MHYHSAEANSKDQREKRKTLRNNSTVAESLLWRVLRNRLCGGWKFRRQQGLGPYILDFYCPELRLCIELDGSSHDYRYEHDEERTTYLSLQGISVLRYKNEQVYTNPQLVADDIVGKYGRRYQSLEGKLETPPLAPPLGWEGNAYGQEGCSSSSSFEGKLETPPLPLPLEGRGMPTGREVVAVPLPLRNRFCIH